MNEKLRAKFAAAVDECVEQSIHKFDYTPRYFIDMLASSHAAEVANRLVESGELQTGFRKLVGYGDKGESLTIEAVMLRPEFQALFSKGNLEAAKWRLEQARELR